MIFVIRECLMLKLRPVSKSISQIQINKLKISIAMIVMMKMIIITIIKFL